MKTKQLSRAILSLTLGGIIMLSAAGCSGQPVTPGGSAFIPDTSETAPSGSTSATDSVSATDGTSDTDASTESTAIAEGSATETPAQTTAGTSAPAANGSTEKPATTTAATASHTHSYKKTEKTSEETKGGQKYKVTVTTYKCSCGDTYSDTKSEKIIAGHTHQYMSTVTVAPTCTKTGILTYNCTCGSSYTETAPVNAAYHSWKTTTVHHDAVYGTRDKTEVWRHYFRYTTINLTDAGLAAGLSNINKPIENVSDGHIPGYYRDGAEETARKAAAKPEQHTILLEEYDIKVNQIRTPYLVKDEEMPETKVQTFLYPRNDGIEGNLCIDCAAVEDAQDKYGYKMFGTWSTWKEYKEYTRVVGTEQYVTKAAYDETVTICSACGAKR